METNETDGPRRLVPIDQAAAYVSMSTKTLRRRIADGSLPAYRFGARKYLIDLRELDAMVRQVSVQS